MARSKSSHRWLKEHFDDPYVKKAKQSGYRSRAAFKLAQLQEKDRLIRPGHIVVDLGAAPGGWSQLAADWVGDQGRVLAVDMLDMTPLPGVEFIQGDFTDSTVFDRVMAALAAQPVDLVISDMAPNISGMKAVDQPRAIYLNELALDFAQRVLRPGGDLLMKVFQGEGFDELLKNLRQHFAKVVIRKPAASRNKSTETYMLGRGYKSQPAAG